MTADTPFKTRRVAEILAREYPAQASHVPGLLQMLDAGLPVPFIARYRKEKSGGMDEKTILELSANPMLSESQLRTLDGELTRFRQAVRR